jgi:hypothetical protein
MMASALFFAKVHLQAVGTITHLSVLNIVFPQTPKTFNRLLQQFARLAALTGCRVKH